MVRVPLLSELTSRRRNVPSTQDAANTGPPHRLHIHQSEAEIAESAAKQAARAARVVAMPERPGARYHLLATGAEADAYDFLADRPPGKRTTVVESTGHLIKSCLGGGIVSIHVAYKQMGLLSALVLNVFLGFAVTYGMHLLATSAQRAYGRTRVPLMSFPDLAECTFDIGPFPKVRRYSKVFRYLVDFIIIIDLFGSCCCYQLLMANQLDEVYTYFYGKSTWLSIRMYVLLLLVPCILLCMIVTLKYLAPFSIVADVFLFIVVVSTVKYGTQNASKSPTEFPLFKTISGFFEFMATCIFSMEGVGVTLALENSMKRPKKITRVLEIGMTCTCLMVMGVGFFGYWGYGEECRAPVTANFPYNTFTTILKLCMVLIIYVTFALNFWIPFNLIWVYLKLRHPEEKHWFWERVYRFIFVVLITIVSITFPDVNKLMGVIGAFCLSNMGFIFPALIDLMLDWYDPGLGRFYWRMWRFIAIFSFGVVLGIIGTFFNFKELISAVYGKKD